MIVTIKDEGNCELVILDIPCDEENEIALSQKLARLIEDETGVRRSFDYTEENDQ